MLCSILFQKPCVAASLPCSYTPCPTPPPYYPSPPPYYPFSNMGTTPNGTYPETTNSSSVKSESESSSTLDSFGKGQNGIINNMSFMSDLRAPVTDPYTAAYYQGKYPDWDAPDTKAYFQQAQQQTQQQHQGIGTMAPPPSAHYPSYPSSAGGWTTDATQQANMQQYGNLNYQMQCKCPKYFCFLFSLVSFSLTVS